MEQGQDIDPGVIMKFYEISQRFMRFAVGTVLILAAGACGSGGSGDGGTPPATPPASVTLTIAKAGVGTGTVTSNPAGINCGTTCTLTVSSGTVVTLTAAPTPNNTLTDWADLSGGQRHLCRHGHGQSNCYTYVYHVIGKSNAGVHARGNRNWGYHL